MAWDDDHGKGSGKGSGKGGRKNPWGERNGGEGGNGGPRSGGPWGSGGHGGEPPPDLDEMLRKAQENLRQVIPGAPGGGKLVLLVLLVLAGLWSASGFFIVTPGEHAVVQRFGAWDRTQTDEGLGWRVPWPVESVRKVNVSEVRRMEIGFIERVGRSGAGAGKQDVPEESLMLTSDANIVDLDLVVLWNIKSAEDFLFNIREQENTIKKVAESAIREVVGQTDMFPIITRARDTVAQRAREIMIENLDDYQSGVNIAQVLIQEAEVHPDVQSAFQDVQSARQDAFDVQNRAQAYRQDILPRARGQAIQLVQEAEAYKQAVTSRAQGDAERFSSILESYRAGEDVTRQRLYLETMEEVLQNASKIILDNEGGVLPYLPLNELRPAAGARRSQPPQPQSNSGGASGSSSQYR